MPVATTIDIYIFCLLILGFIYLNTRKRAERAQTQHRLFMALTGTLALLMIADTATRILDGLPGGACLISNWAFNIILYLLVPFVPSLYVLYVDFQIFRDEKRLRRLLWPLGAYVVLDIMFTLSTVFTGWMFTVDASNLYHRGPWIAYHTAACYLLLAYSVTMILRNKKRIDARYFTTLLLFALPPAVGGLIQGFVPGLALIWSGMTLSVLLLYFHIQDYRLDTDYLTGAYNRGLLDRTVRDRIRAAVRGGQSFAAILIDMDDFKEINDSHGHITGDDALTDTVGLLMGCLRHGDIIARYGGDEFLVLLDIDRQDQLDGMVRRIRGCFEQFNRGGNRPYSLSFSIGAAVYDPLSGLNAEGFLGHIDRLMYQDKKTEPAAGTVQNSLLT